MKPSKIQHTDHAKKSGGGYDPKIIRQHANEACDLFDSGEEVVEIMFTTDLGNGKFLRGLITQKT